MLPVAANAAADKRPARDLLADYAAHLALTGRGNTAYTTAAQSFLQRWPTPQAWADQPLPVRLEAGSATKPFLMFLMVHGWLRPGWDWLVSRKLSSFWREIVGTPLEADLTRFLAAAEAVGFTPIQAVRLASQSIGRLLLQTGRPLDELTVTDLDDLTAACRDREVATGQGWGHYRAAINAAHRVLFHLEVTDAPPASLQLPRPLADRVADAPPALRPRFAAYLERKLGTCRPKTVSSLATRLAHFGRFLAEIDLELASLADLDRCRHIEPYLNSVASAVSTKTGDAISTADQARRIIALAGFFSDITEW